MKRPEVFLSVGSNQSPEDNLRRGLEALRARYGRLRRSPVYRNRAVGFDGDDFLNLVVAFETGVPPRQLTAELDEIEDACGRDRSQPRFGPRTLDLDLMLYGGLVVEEPGLILPRPDLLDHAFMLGPLAALAGDRRHPVTGRSFAEHWQAFDRPSHPLLEVHVPGVSPGE